ncbi:CheR family methyltransferase [Campylobacter pinnipediorum]|uniref:SAM-dependent methyltransferase n=1 Tax=Campylobacter pinnipediorum subsp. pinnipediorum TaxID=1660067 RepID=A0AAX0LBS6_9BACT|nr:CheR family methyltransferase [Campylobacter pinnipediorum]AQW81513.1 MCP protein methyltransferase [Campylobacter pinnipediorum subsp. pinnipediorum]AQW83141.1 MCP protein methyltransferase [Campylobacter pinnipediorum subsp. pinnipediorum]AQW84708.1 MCP protein methyltransferase [Campylobacter pinnipediorum subsp. pinnipediorum]OPA81822.1 SAM-dependent methyltransferase [Campylobacter pinnipediorum subsp. pinnipediorum]
MLFKKNNQEINNNNQTEFPLPTDIDGIDDFIKNIKVLSGVDLEPKREITIQRLEAFAKNKRIKTFKEIASIIKYNSETRQDILNLITVNETYFYRELPQLKDVITYAKELPNANILCAPCSTGDEVYSLAMIANEMGMDPKLLHIIGIDINSQAIKQANSGVYNDRNLHRLNDFQKNKFFELQNDKYSIKKHNLAKCEFKVLNVFDDSIFNIGKFDIILSRNMMIYFDDNFRLKCIERLHKILKDDGRLYTGHADLIPYTSIYKKKFGNGVTFYEKD